MKQTVEDLIARKSFRAVIDEQIVFNQIGKNENAVWSLLLAAGYLKVLDVDPLTVDKTDDPYYTLCLTNLEVVRIFKKMVRDWFEIEAEGSVYNDFVKAMLLDDLDYMNEFMNEIALRSFSEFDIAKSVSGANAHLQIQEKHYEATLIAAGYSSERIRKYGFALKGKECLIG